MLVHAGGFAIEVVDGGSPGAIELVKQFPEQPI